jgi:hypothetical protein
MKGVLVLFPTQSIIGITSLAIFTFCSGFSGNSPFSDYYSTIEKRVGYRLDTPSEKHILGLELDGISGIHYLGKNRFAAVHDEEGRIFIYDANEIKVVERIKFDKSGDYEDLEMVNNTYYILRSDGKLYHLDPEDPENVTEFKTEIKNSNDAEGLTYIKKGNKLLIALKGKAEVDDNKADGKGFYTFDLDREELSEEPLFTIHKKQIRASLADSLRNEPFADPLNFSPSGVAIHPITKQIYILSHQTKWLIVLNKDFSIDISIPLLRKVFRQPEGITFAPNGDLFISNEAGEGSANILKFEYQKAK